MVSFKDNYRRFGIPTLLLVMFCMFVTGCGGTEPFHPAADGSNYLVAPEHSYDDNELSRIAASTERRFNIWTTPSIPTLMTCIDETWYLVDCYHNLIIFNDAPDAQYISLNNWQVMNSEATQPHTIAGDGKVLLVDDTENNRVQVFRRAGDKFINTQNFWNIGNRPHYTVYDKDTDTFYVWSSLSGELFLFRRAEDTGDVYMTEVRSIERLRGVYIRSFTIDDGKIWFVSGTPTDETPSYQPSVLCCDLKTLEVIKEYPVPDSIAGMTQMFHLRKDFWLVSVSTDINGNQDAAALLKINDPSDLETGNYEDIYAEYFQGGGTPYYISEVDGYFYLTEHRLEDHFVWRFELDENGSITHVVTLF